MKFSNWGSALKVGQIHIGLCQCIIISSLIYEVEIDIFKISNKKKTHAIKNWHKVNYRSNWGLWHPFEIFFYMVNI